jgi:hypothetical protein
MLALGAGNRVISHHFKDRYEVLPGEIPDIEIILLDVSTDETQLHGTHNGSPLFPVHNWPRGGQPLTGRTGRSHAWSIVQCNRLHKGSVSQYEFQGQCAKAGFRPVFRVLKTESEVIDLAAQPYIASFLSRFGSGTKTFLNERAQQLVMLGPILLTLKENNRVEGFVGWLTK